MIFVPFYSLSPAAVGAERRRPMRQAQTRTGRGTPRPLRRRSEPPAPPQVRAETRGMATLALPPMRHRTRRPKKLRQLPAIAFFRVSPNVRGSAPLASENEVVAQRIPQGMARFNGGLESGRDQKLSMQRNSKSAMKIATVASDAAVGGYATSRHFPETLCSLRSLWLKQLDHSTSHPQIFGIRLINISTFQPFNLSTFQPFNRRFALGFRLPFC